MTGAPGAVRAVGYTAAAWCLGFAGVSAWQVVAGPAGPPEDPSGTPPTPPAWPF